MFLSYKLLQVLQQFANRRPLPRTGIEVPLRRGAGTAEMIKSEIMAISMRPGSRRDLRLLRVMP
ncbi:hypothetical protein C664_13087 [Thauera sp. 63]|nr:hypothetical protein C664_13087 [Thauera sp. 63]